MSLPGAEAEKHRSQPTRVSIADQCMLLRSVVVLRVSELEQSYGCDSCNVITRHLPGLLHWVQKLRSDLQQPGLRP